MAKPSTSDEGAIHKQGSEIRNANGDGTGKYHDAGVYVMHADGRLVLIPPHAYGALKPGQRLATRDDIAKKEAEEEARQEAEKSDSFDTSDTSDDEPIAGFNPVDASAGPQQ